MLFCKKLGYDANLVGGGWIFAQKWVTLRAFSRKARKAIKQLIMNNNLWKSWVLALLVILALMGLYFLPKISVGNTELRRVNILSDVQRRHNDGAPQPVDSVVVVVEPPANQDIVPEGMTPIEDFADSAGINREMDKFYRALNHAKSRPVRVAYFGDSFVEGDILTMDLRAMLQKRFGGRGVGFVEVECVTSGFRTSVYAKSAKWESHHANDSCCFRSSLQGIAGSYFIARDSATMRLFGQKKLYPSLLDTAEVATVYFAPSQGLAINAKVNGKPCQLIPQDNESDSAAVAASSVEGRIGRFNMMVRGGGSRFFGVALDARNGIALDNLSMRGSGGQFIASIPMTTLKGFAKLRPYDLIIINFGLNVANRNQTDYSYYAQSMGKAIRHLQKAFPNASILVMSMGDRGTRGDDGEIHTMPGVRELIGCQRKMASDCGVAFWSLYEAMGGDGSIGELVKQRQANLDYTHINAAGGKRLAALLFDVLMNGKENYDKRTDSK